MSYLRIWSDGTRDNGPRPDAPPKKPGPKKGSKRRLSPAARAAAVERVRQWRKLRAATR
jgi:hypothetical protein